MRANGKQLHEELLGVLLNEATQQKAFATYGVTINNAQPRRRSTLGRLRFNRVYRLYKHFVLGVSVSHG